MTGHKNRPEVAKAYLDVAKAYSSPLLVGPPICDELIALVQHMFTEEEAELVRHMKPMRPHTAAGLAKAAGKTLEEALEILRRIAHDRHLLAYYGKGNGEKERFMLMPIMPGAFEDVMLNLAGEIVTPWHARFAELCEALFDTGYMVDHVNRPVNPVRYLPVGEVVEALPNAYPSDKLEAILERYSEFAVGQCQCRLSRQLVGKGCGKSLETCTAMGSVVPFVVNSGRMKKASMQDVLDIKRAAEKEGMVTWMMNADSDKFTSNNTCSCCACCCEALRTVSEFSHPGFIAPPHFMPVTDDSRCKPCGDCAKACPMGAMVLMETGDKRWIEHRPERCIGCGLCVVACTQKAKSLREVPDYKEPLKNVLGYTSRFAFNTMRNAFHVFHSRRRKD